MKRKTVTFDSEDFKNACVRFAINKDGLLEEINKLGLWRRLDELRESSDSDETGRALRGGTPVSKIASSELNSYFAREDKRHSEWEVMWEVIMSILYPKRSKS